MGSGYAGNYAWTIDLEGLKQICPETLGTLEKYLDFIALPMDDFCKWYSQGYDIDASDEQQKQLKLLWEAVQDDFRTKSYSSGTSCEISPNFHDKYENGDRYDDVSGPFFEVSGMVMITPAGIKMGGLVKQSTWVTWG